MCGAVRFTATADEFGMSACHCDMCRRWTGGPLLSVGPVQVTWQGEEHITVLASSAWAERGFCRVCGSGLFYRVNAEGPHNGFTHVPLGTFDEQDGLTISKEWFYDRKPDTYELAGERRRITAAEVHAMFGGG